MWARLERGDKVAELMSSAVSRVATQVLQQGTGAQVDASFGFTAGVAEALIQSHAGEISLLPALPTGWDEAGEVTGLRARGDYEVDMKWAKGKLITARISKTGGGECRIRYNGKLTKLVIPKDKSTVINE